MKNILVPTDFSANATHAAAYVYQLAKQLKADIILCNAITVPAESPQAGLVVWPMEEFGMLVDDSEKKLKRLKASLQLYDRTDDLRPEITFVDKSGTVVEVVKHIVDTQNIDLVSIGSHSNDMMTTLLLGNHCSQLIDNLSKLLIIIPSDAKFKSIKKIAIAVDLESADKDLEEIYKLIPLAKALNSEILIAHIQTDKEPSAESQKHIDRFLTELTNKADYDNIFYRIVKSDDTEKGLNWLCEHGQVDMLAMLHRQHGFFDSLFNGSHTQRMVSRVGIPLLVISA